MPCGSHLHNKNNYLPAFSATRKQSPQQGRRKEWQNVTIWQPTISVGLFRNFRISLDFRTPTKRWLLIVSKGDNCHHFDIFCHWMPVKHPLEPTWRTLRNGLCRHHQGQKTCFDLTDEDTIAVDLWPLRTVSTGHCMIKLVYTTKYQGL